MSSKKDSKSLFNIFLQKLYSDSACTFQHFLDFCWQVELIGSSDGQPCCVDFSRVKVLYPGGDFLFVFSADSLGCGKFSLGFKAQTLSRNLRYFSLLISITRILFLITNIGTSLYLGIITGLTAPGYRCKSNQLFAHTQYVSINFL